MLAQPKVDRHQKAGAVVGPMVRNGVLHMRGPDEVSFLGNGRSTAQATTRFRRGRPPSWRRWSEPRRTISTMIIFIGTPSSPLPRTTRPGLPEVYRSWKTPREPGQCVGLFRAVAYALQKSILQTPDQTYQSSTKWTHFDRAADLGRGPAGVGTELLHTNSRPTSPAGFDWPAFRALLCNDVSLPRSRPILPAPWKPGRFVPRPGPPPPAGRLRLSEPRTFSARTRSHALCNSSIADTPERTHLALERAARRTSRAAHTLPYIPESETLAKFEPRPASTVLLCSVLQWPKAHLTRCLAGTSITTPDSRASSGIGRWRAASTADQSPVSAPCREQNRPKSINLRRASKTHRVPYE